MTASRPRILVAAAPAAIPNLREALGPHVEMVPAVTLEEALLAFREETPRLVVVGYHFDALRPFRIIRRVRAEASGARVPIVLVRSLPLYLGAGQEAELRRGYEQLGVNEFFNLCDEMERTGHDAALARLRTVLLGHLPRRAVVRDQGRPSEPVSQTRSTKQEG